MPQCYWLALRTCRERRSIGHLAPALQQVQHEPFCPPVAYAYEPTMAVAAPSSVGYGVLLPASCPLLRAPLPCRHAVMPMQAAALAGGSRVFVHVVAAVPHERPGQPLAHHDGA